MQNQFQAPSPNIETTICVVSPAETAEVETAQALLNAQAVTDLLVKTQHNIRRRNVRLWMLYVILVGISCLPLMLLPNTALVTYSLPLAVGISALMLGLFWVVSRNTSINFDELTRLGGRKAIPMLMEAQRSTAVRINREVVRANLLNCLPQMQAADAVLVTASDRHYLNEILRSYLLHTQSGRDLPLALATLKAYAQVGNASAIPVVAQLADMKPRNESQRILKQAAQECLPLLRARVGGLEPEQTLLRASTSNTVTPDTLLRAAMPVTNAPESELLRAADGKEAASD